MRNGSVSRSRIESTIVVPIDRVVGAYGETNSRVESEPDISFSPSAGPVPPQKNAKRLGSVTGADMYCERSCRRLLAESSFPSATGSASLAGVCLPPLGLVRPGDVVPPVGEPPKKFGERTGDGVRDDRGVQRMAELARGVHLLDETGWRAAYTAFAAPVSGSVPRVFAE